MGDAKEDAVLPARDRTVRIDIEKKRFVEEIAQKAAEKQVRCILWPAIVVLAILYAIVGFAFAYGLIFPPESRSAEPTGLNTPSPAGRLLPQDRRWPIFQSIGSI